MAYCPLHCCRNTRTTEKVYNFLKCTNLICLVDLSTKKQFSVCQSQHATAVLCDSLTSFWYIDEQEGVFSFLGWNVIHVGQVCAFEKSLGFVVFRVLRQQFYGKILIMRQLKVFLTQTKIEDSNEELIIKISVRKNEVRIGEEINREKKLFCRKKTTNIVDLRD